jgi:hypothetical protein
MIGAMEPTALKGFKNISDRNDKSDILSETPYPGGCHHGKQEVRNV